MTTFAMSPGCCCCNDIYLSSIPRDLEINTNGASRLRSAGFAYPNNTLTLKDYVFGFAWSTMTVDPFNKLVFVHNNAQGGFFAYQEELVNPIFVGAYVGVNGTQIFGTFAHWHQRKIWFFNYKSTDPGPPIVDVYSVKSMDYDTGNVVELTTDDYPGGSTGGPQNMAYDKQTSRLYYSIRQADLPLLFQHGRIFYINALTGGNKTLIYEALGSTGVAYNLTHLAIDQSRRRVFWWQHNISGTSTLNTMKSCNMNGGDVQDHLTIDFNPAIGFDAGEGILRPWQLVNIRRGYISHKDDRYFWRMRYGVPSANNVMFSWGLADGSRKIHFNFEQGNLDNVITDFGLGCGFETWGSNFAG